MTTVEILDRLKALEEKYDIVSKELEELKDKNEVYYQRYLEKLLGGSHKVTKYGITDISTDFHHVEIKQWKNFKTCIGQLLSYNFKDNKQLIAAFFGDYKDKCKIIELCHSKNIEVWDLMRSGDGIEIEKYHIQRAVDFHCWLDRHIEDSNFTTDYVELKLICEMYLNKTNLSSRVTTVYKKEIENFIKNKFPMINWSYKQLDHLPSRPRGWACLKFKLT